MAAVGPRTSHTMWVQAVEVTVKRGHVVEHRGGFLVAVEVPFCGVVAYVFFLNDRAATEIYTLSLHDALPISIARAIVNQPDVIIADEPTGNLDPVNTRSEEHTSELQSRFDLVCRLLLEK